MSQYGSDRDKNQDGSGVPITSTNENGKQALDVHVTGGTVTPLVNFSTRVDTYTVPANGTTVDVSAIPLKNFTLQVKGTGSIASAWIVVIEGSLDGANWTPMMMHTHRNGDGTIIYCGALVFPTLYFRSRCSALTLGPATNLVVTILGVV